MKGDLAKRYGPTTNAAEESLHLRNLLHHFCQGLFAGLEPCVVDAFDPSTLRVSVRLKNHPQLQVFSDIPVDDGGGPLQIVNLAIERGQVGYIAFFRSDSRGSFNDEGIRDPDSHECHSGLGAVYSTGPKLRNEALPSFVVATATSDPDQVGVGDVALIHKTTGARLVFRANGDIALIPGPNGKIKAGDMDNLTAAAKVGSAVVGGSVTTGANKIEVG